MTNATEAIDKEIINTEARIDQIQRWHDACNNSVQKSALLGEMRRLKGRINGLSFALRAIEACK